MDDLSFFYKIVVNKHFSCFNMASKMAAKGHVTILIIIGSNECFMYKKHSVRVSQQLVEWFW